MNGSREKLLTLNEAQKSVVYKNLFCTDEGQLVLEDMKQRFFYYSSLPSGEEGQRGEGSRRVLLHIESFMSLIEKEMANVNLQETTQTEEDEKI